MRRQPKKGSKRSKLVFHVDRKMKTNSKRYLQVNYSFMKPLSLKFEVLTHVYVINPKLARKGARTRILCANGNRKMKIKSKSNIERSSRPELFCEKGVLRNFTKFTWKHLCQSLFFDKFAGLRPATLLKRRLWHTCFPVNFVKFLRTPIFIEHIWWLRLHWGEVFVYETIFSKFWNSSPTLHVIISKLDQKDSNL